MLSISKAELKIHNIKSHTRLKIHRGRIQRRHAKGTRRYCQQDPGRHGVGSALKSDYLDNEKTNLFWQTVINCIEAENKLFSGKILRKNVLERTLLD